MSKSILHYCKKVYHIVKKYLSPQTDLLIYDTIFPMPASGFRLEEFSAYLHHYTKCKLYVHPTDYKVIKLDPTLHKGDLENYTQSHPTVENKIVVGKLGSFNIKTKLFYCVFLNNIYAALPYLEATKTSFIFTLYPGGGFSIEDDEALAKLKRVLSSKYLKKVLVTQKYIYDYLIHNHGLDKNKLELIYGCIVPQKSVNNIRTRYYNIGDIITICFCAHKYMPQGLDKGYDLFIEVTKKLCDLGINVHANVIGNFDATDIDIVGYEDHITFLGIVEFDKLSSIFQQQDFILSLNRPFVLSKGSFDGFPLGTVIEAAFNGVIPIVTDPLNENVHFSDDEIIIVPDESDFVVKKIIELVANPSVIKELSIKSQKKFKAVFSNENQLSQRLRLISHAIKEYK